MKSILVLTDFSKNAAAAEQYALDLAVTCGANLVLFNAYAARSVPVGNLVVWPHDTFSSAGLRSLSNLQVRLEDLKARVESLPPGVFRPEISHSGGEGAVAECVRKELDFKQMWMVVMGTRGESSLPQALWGSNVPRVLSVATVPVLVVPPGAGHGGIRKIVYATDFRNNDSRIINWLKDFCQQNKAVLTLLHVSPVTRSNLVEKDRGVAGELPGIAGTGIQVQYFHDSDILEALRAVERSADVDLLALMHRKHGFFEQLFHPGIARGVIRHTPVPVLVFPG